EASPATGTGGGGATGTSAGASGAGAGAGASGDHDPGTTATNDAPGIDLVVPERPGELVAPVRAKLLKGGGLAVPVRLPATPGLYRLVATIHGSDGVA